jgi:hypothetical protein
MPAEVPVLRTLHRPIVTRSLPLRARLLHVGPPGLEVPVVTPNRLGSPFR